METQDYGQVHQIQNNQFDLLFHEEMNKMDAVYQRIQNKVRMTTL